MTWAVVWEYPYDGESEVTLWNTEMLALGAACSEIQNCIYDNWDMTDVTQAAEAHYINNLISAGQYRDALDYWNSSSVNTDSDGAQYWNVYEKEIYDYTKSPNITIFAPDHFTALLDEEDEDEDEDDDDEEEAPVTAPSPQPYQAIAPGATCRKCQNPNEHAYADRPDGTYCCYQCKMLSQVFGS